MGSFSDLIVAGYPLFTAKNSFYQDIVDLIFLKEDYIEETLTEPDENDNTEFRGYKQSAKVCRERLEIYGHNLQWAKQNFKAAKQRGREESELGYYFDISFERYLELVGTIIHHKIKRKPEDMNKDHVAAHLIEYELVLYETLSMPNMLTCVFSVLPDDAVVAYDMTWIVDNWVSREEILSVNPEKIIILTEGKTDSEFISKSLQILYPHLYPYYHFMDFEEYKLESNASMLGKLITAFAAANIRHHLIALFDNDATGVMEYERARQNKLGLRQKVLKLPDLALAKNYPTIGPSGKKRMNINGKACAIELYLGEDILTGGQGLMPIQWTALNAKTGRYQGELADKGLVHQRFRDKLKQGSTQGFEGMDTVLKTIFKAFDSPKPKKAKISKPGKIVQ